MPRLAATDVPPAFEQRAFDQTSAANAPIWPSADWWQGFNSPELNDLIAKAQANNLDIQAAEARLIQADAQVRATGSALLPSIDAGAGASRQTSNAIGPQGTGESHTNSLSAGLSASYQLDFWGSNLDALRSARAARKASTADRQTVAMTTISSTASTYFQLLSLREQLAIARENLDNAQQVYKITESRVRNGTASPLDDAQQLATLASQKAQIPKLQQQELQARSALAVLLGLPPEGFDVSGQDIESVGAPAVAAGLTSELLVRRPDIVAAEANLAAANANLAAARAAYFPSISLTGNGGYSSSQLSTLFSSGNFVYSIGANLAQTIFDGGKLIAQNDSAYAKREEILADYRKAVISAFSDVEQALGNVAHLTEQQDLQAEQVRQSERAFQIAQARYREGVDDYLTVLSTQQSLYSARSSFSQTKLSRLQAVVALYVALGGGWRDEDAQPMQTAAAAAP